MFNIILKPYHKKEYDDDWLIKPNQKSSKELIIKEWEQIKKIVVSLATKTSTQSTIVSKLCSYERKNSTQKALWELDSIIQSSHILRYIDDISYRQNIQKALNRGESLPQATQSSFIC